MAEFPLYCLIDTWHACMITKDLLDLSKIMKPFAHFTIKIVDHALSY